ncbi:hypothetical protein [Adhaeribacter rhizoryzae]|uniref:Cytochrome B n=1 Tax=Adhaeribacter rhizoryzae TaxID=2607907 RepID=A0A5M6DJ46_9BACT|nr:hypothetical protein [Adhaeribacter rhizoryzae]KAA5547564.1 hypothetical protein F0145_09625 [Adhaeribacter rhizoryzae]
MYNFLLHFHSINRWLVLIAALIVIIQSFSGWRNHSPFTKGNNITHSAFVGFVHLQFLTGILLYFVFSPITQQIFNDFGAAMKNSTLRFWAVEHILGMFIGTVLAQVGRTASKKATTNELKHKRAFIYTLIALIIILLSIPFGIINPETRPLWR